MKRGQHVIRKLGKCPKCGYPDKLRKSGLCDECDRNASNCRAYRVRQAAKAEQGHGCVDA